MDLELATLDDIIDELHRRDARFVFVGVEPSNEGREKIHTAAQGNDVIEVRRLLRIGRSVF